MTKITNTSTDQLLLDIRSMIDGTKVSVARNINAEITMLYWSIGKRISVEVLRRERAEYGKQIVSKLAANLSTEYGKGFTYTSLTRMLKFYDSFVSHDIVATLSQQLNWSHIIELLPLKDQKQKEFYAFMAIQDNWSVRYLRHNIDRMTYERTIAAKNNEPIALVASSDIRNRSSLSPNMIFKDPYILEFLELKPDHLESDLENAILQKIEKFILEMGTGFSFVARQKRITIDNDHFYIDLLLFNRKLKRLCAIELKTGKFKAEYKGQMELYLNWLKQYECFEGENSPIGIILCTSKSRAQIELLDVGSSGIHVAEYWTDLPPIDVFERKLQEIVLEAKNQYESKEVIESNNEL